uniref:Uncharacterized protein n=1 Tax=Arundo donax TaxID=35708 RepID=A0A0A9EIL6_ARUDO
MMSISLCIVLQIHPPHRHPLAST